MRFHVTAVEATFLPDGWPQPHSLLWEGDTLVVVEVGRRWRADDGVHMLARVSDGRVFELHTNGALWQAALLSAPPHVV